MSSVIIKYNVDLLNTERNRIEQIVGMVMDDLNIKEVYVNSGECFNCDKTTYVLTFCFDNDYKYRTCINKIDMLQLVEYNYLCRFEANNIISNIKFDYLKTNKVIY